MAGLILKLRPNEQLMVNGVLIENGDRNARLRVKSDGANILRMRDALRPEEATTPIRKAYYIAQLAVAGALPHAQAAEILRRAAADAFDAKTRAEIESRLSADDFYGVMKQLRQAGAAEFRRAAAV